MLDPKTKPKDPNSLISTPEEDANPVDRREVLPSDIIPFAKHKCRSCWGTGIFIRVVAGEREEALCACAVTRFLKLTPNIDVEVGPKRAGKLWFRDPAAESVLP